MCSCFPGMATLVWQWLQECNFLLENCLAAFAFHLHPCHMLLLFPWRCCWISDMVFSSWAPFSVTAWCGQEPLATLVQGGLRIFLLTVFLALLRSASLLTLTFGLPSLTHTFIPLTRLIFQHRDSISHKMLAKIRAVQACVPADRNSPKSHAGGLPSIAKATEAGLQAHDSATCTD